MALRLPRRSSAPNVAVSDADVVAGGDVGSASGSASRVGGTMSATSSHPPSTPTPQPAVVSVSSLPPPAASTSASTAVSQHGWQLPQHIQLPPHSQPPQQQQQQQHLPRQIALYPALALPAPLPPPLPLQEHTHICCVPSHNGGGMHPPTHINLAQPIYVLAPDGSQLYLVDPSKPPRNEEPPPYLPFRSEAASPSGSRDGANGNSSGGASGGVTAAPSAGNQTPRPNSPRSPVSPSSRAHSPRLRTLEAATPLHVPADPRRRAATVGSGQRAPYYATSPPYRGSPRPSSIRYGDETTPLLDREAQMPRWRLSEVLGGWKADGGGVKGYFAPVGDKAHWKAVGHLAVMNFPFNLLIWPWLLVGTLVGTALLITLPLGAVFWWLTLILARWAAGQERKMQTRYHGAVFPPHRPIFHYAAEIRTLEAGPVVVYERRFWRCSWAMFSDYYSYAALSYFLLVKPVVILFSTIAIVALLPITIVLFPLFPIYLRATRAWGWYQARIAMENV